jgi:hypothetical protein
MTHQALPEVGTRIRLIEMPHDPNPIEPGTLGTVTSVHEKTRQIGVKWDNGRGLFLIIGVDKFEVVTPFRVVLIEDNAYARFEAFVEATDADQAAGVARELVVDGKADGSGQHFRDEAYPYVTDVINHEGDECAFSEEHGFEGVTVPDLLKARDTCADVIETIDEFAVSCERAQHTDVGLVWEILNAIRTKLHEALPRHMQEEATRYLAELSTTPPAEADEEEAA